MQTKQRDTKAWIKAVAEHVGVSLSELARRSGMAPNVLTRYVNDRSGRVGISQASLDKIYDYSGIAPHHMPGHFEARGFQESEARRFEMDDVTYSEGMREDVAEAVSGRNNQVPWVLKGRALDLVGCLPGDVLIVDHARDPRNGDIVCAQIYDLDRGTGETVFRIWTKPFIMSASSAGGLARPMTVDDVNVKIMGVVVRQMRDLESFPIRLAS